MIEKPYAELMRQEPPGRPWRAAAALAFAAAAVSIACLAVDTGRLRAAQEQLASNARELEASQEKLAKPPEPVHAAEMKEALAMAELPWPQALAALEQARSAGGRVVGLEMSAHDRTVQLEVELAVELSLASYVAQLNGFTDAWQWVPRATSAANPSARSAVIVARPRE